MQKSYLYSLNTNFPPCYKVNFEVPSIAPMKLLYRQEVLRRLDPYLRVDWEVAKRIEDLTEKGLKDIFASSVTELKGRIKKYCQPSEFNLDLQQMLMSFFEKQVERYRINNPDNEVFEEKWNEFVQAIAALRLSGSNAELNDLQLLTTAENYLNYIHEELKKIDHKLPPGESKKETEIWNIFKYILKQNKLIYFLNLPVSYLAGLTTLEDNATLPTYVPYLIESNNQILARLLKNVPWVLSFCEEKLKPHAEKPQDPNLNCAKSLLTDIQRIKKDILPGIPLLYLSDCLNCTPTQNNFAQKLIDLFGKWSLKNDNPTIEYDHTKKLLHLKNCCPPNFVYSLIKIECLRNELAKLNQQNNLADTKEARAQLEEAIAFHQTLNECAQLVGAFFRIPAFHLCGLFQTIYQWRSQLDPQVLKQLKVPEKSIDEMVRDIQSAPSSQRVKKKASSIPSKPSSPKSVGQSAQAIDVAKVQKSCQSSKKKDINPKIPFIVEVSELFLKAFEANYFSNISSKDFARQALIYLTDLHTAQKYYQNASTEESKLFYLITMIQSGYFHLEQMLHFYSRSDELKGDGHHLLFLRNQTNLPDLNKEAILNDLFLANYWVRSVEEQIKKREQWDIPLYLSEIKKIYNSTPVKGTIDKVRSIGQRVAEFTNKLPIIADMKRATLINRVATIEVETFHHETTFNLTECQQLAARCDRLRQRIPSLWRSKFEQAVYHFRLLRGILDELSKADIPSDLFSLLVRSLLFWENTVLEELLQVLYGMKKGCETHSHRLNELYESILDNTEEASEGENLKFLNEKMSTLHNLSRYPFQTVNGSEYLHDMILQAELLRERPELGKNFTMSQNKTPLNYLAVSEKDFTPHEIVAKLQGIHQKIFGIISQILPKIEREASLRT